MIFSTFIYKTVPYKAHAGHCTSVQNIVFRAGNHYLLSAIAGLRPVARQVNIMIIAKYVFIYNKDYLQMNIITAAVVDYFSALLYNIKLNI